MWLLNIFFCQIASDSPVLPNPNITQTNSTHLTLLWSPPFLWPGQRINHYHVLFTTKRECILTEYRVNSNYSDEIVSLTINHPICAEFEILVSAIGNDASELRAFNISGQFIPPSKKHTLLWVISDSNNGLLIIVSDAILKIINISVYFAAANGQPAMIEVYIQVLRT